MKQKLFGFLNLILMLAATTAPQLTQLRLANAQNRNINVNEALDLNDLGFDNEVQRINTLLGAQTRFFKRPSELKQVQGIDTSGYSVSAIVGDVQDKTSTQSGNF